MKDIVFWIGILSVIFLFYMILKPQKWEKDLLKDKK